MNKCISIIILILTFCGSIKAYDYPVSDIPDSLTTDAVSVVRDYTAKCKQIDKNNGTYNVTKVVTILNKQGDDQAHFSFGGDKFSEMSKFSGIIRNASGSIIRKIKKGDLTHSSIDTDALASDNYSLYYNCQSPSYPFTVEYSYEIKLKNGIIGYPGFAPQIYSRQSIEKGIYTLEVPLNTNIRHKINFDGKIDKTTTDKSIVYSISVNAIKSIPAEIMTPPTSEIFPLAQFSLSEFCFDSYCGNISTWKDFGLWINQLLKDRDTLPSDLVAKLKDMTAECGNDRERVKVIYEYLQNNHRYISIQLGIGGLQPFKASDVVRTGFGDCKGLTNLMKAMLKAVDIPSNYCAIYMDYEEKTCYPDFSSANQFNHVVLLVPLKNDSIWLECTSKTSPFGFIHNSIAGHDALVISEEGGKICRLPSYPNEKKRSENNLAISIKEDGSINGELKITEYLDNAQRLESRSAIDRKAKTDYINRIIKLPKMQVGDISISYNKSEEPSAHLITDFEAFDFINKTGNRLFVPICPLNKGSFNIFSANTRAHDINVSSVFLEYDTITYKLPEGYSVESLPKDVDIQNQFGSLNIQTQQDNSSVLYTQRIELKPGRYDKSSYKELKDFYAQIESALKQRLVLRKD